MVKQIPTKEYLFGLADANAQTGKKVEGCGDGRVLGGYGRDELNSYGKLKLAFASDHKLALRVDEWFQFFSVFSRNIFGKSRKTSPPQNVASKLLGFFRKFRY